MFDVEINWRAADTAETIARARDWQDGFYADMGRFMGRGALQNFVDPSLKNPQGAYFGDNLPRLRLVKAKVDPDFAFRFAQGIAPA